MLHKFKNHARIGGRQRREEIRLQKQVNVTMKSKQNKGES
jgi:hypothetical protein